MSDPLKKLSHLKKNIWKIVSQPLQAQATHINRQKVPQRIKLKKKIFFKYVTDKN